MENSELINEMTIEEIVEFWAPLHDKDKITKDTLKTEKDEDIVQLCYLIANKLTEDDKLFMQFFASEVDYDYDKLDKLTKRVNRHTRIAEYLHLKDNPKMIMHFISLLMD